MSWPEEAHWVIAVKHDVMVGDGVVQRISRESVVSTKHTEILL